SPSPARRSARKAAGAPAVLAKSGTDIDGAWPDDPGEVRELIVSASGTAPLPALLRAVERIREREPSEPAARRREWMQARATADVALATRGSRLALYDLRESLEGADSPLPVEFLAALTAIGDQSCLEPIAAAYARTVEARRGREDWWRQHLADAFHTI